MVAIGTQSRFEMSPFFAHVIVCGCAGAEPHLVLKLSVDWIGSLYGWTE